MSPSIILDKCVEFSLECIKLYKILQQNSEFIISKQMLRSATSIWANVAEATAAQSKKDFYAKICIAYKEAHETKYWLILLYRSDLASSSVLERQKDCDEIIKILAKIKLTTEQNISENIL